MEKNKYRMKFRVAGVAVQGQQVLLYRSEQNTYWSLPGGCIEPFESAAEALVREMQEETGLSVEAGRLIWITENFFNRRGKAIHEFALYHQMTFCEPLPHLWEGREKDARLFFQWYDIVSLNEIELVPPFLKQALAHIPDCIEHFVLGNTRIVVGDGFSGGV